MNSNEPLNSDPGAGPIQFACHEVWGGNRSIKTPIALPGIQGTLFSKSFQSSRGGDIYYLSVCGSGLLSRICVADVTGHGEAVASIGAAFHDQMRKFMNRFDQRRILGRLNRQICKTGIEGMATALSCTYFPPTGRLSVSTAGHEPAWWFRARPGEWSRLTVSDGGRLSNIALGVEPRTRYSRRKVRVEHGDRLVFVTDGILETMDSMGNQFGKKRLDDCLRQNQAKSCTELTESILNRLAEHADHRRPEQDDVTILVLEFVDNIGTSALNHALRNRLGFRPRKLREINP